MIERLRRELVIAYMRSLGFSKEVSVLYRKGSLYLMDNTIHRSSTFPKYEKEFEGEGINLEDEQGYEQLHFEQYMTSRFLYPILGSNYGVEEEIISNIYLDLNTVADRLQNRFFIAEALDPSVRPYLFKAEIISEIALIGTLLTSLEESEVTNLPEPEALTLNKVTDFLNFFNNQSLGKKEKELFNSMVLEEGELEDSNFLALWFSVIHALFYRQENTPKSYIYDTRLRVAKPNIEVVLSFSGRRRKQCIEIGFPFYGKEMSDLYTVLDFDEKNYTGLTLYEIREAFELGNSRLTQVIHRIINNTEVSSFLPSSYELNDSVEIITKPFYLMNNQDREVRLLVTLHHLNDDVIIGDHYEYIDQIATKYTETMIKYFRPELNRNSELWLVVLTHNQTDWQFDGVDVKLSTDASGDLHITSILKKAIDGERNMKFVDNRTIRPVGYKTKLPSWLFEQIQSYYKIRDYKYTPSIWERDSDADWLSCLDHTIEVITKLRRLPTLADNIQVSVWLAKQSELYKTKKLEQWKIDKLGSVGITLKS